MSRDNPDYRKPVGIVVEQREGADGLPYVVCDDGAVFYLSIQGGHWEEDEPIPGTSRAQGNVKDGDVS